MYAPPRRTGMLTFTIGNAVAQASALLRYLVLARVLGPGQLGIAAMLILVSQFFDQISDAGFDRLLIQSSIGNTRTMNATVHGALILRGLAISSTITLTSGLIARFFHQPAMQHALLLLAVAPIMNCFTHYDFRRVQRHHRFASDGVMTIVSELASLITIVVVVLLTRSFVAVAWSLIVRGLVAAIMSQLLARRPYSVKFDRRHFQAMTSFGLPLMANGVLLFLTGQGDRLFIGNQLGAEALGHYSAVILLIFYPATMLSRLVQSINLPIISERRANVEFRSRAINRLAGQASTLGLAMTMGFAFIAPFAVPILYGKQFTLPILLLALIGVLQGARFMRLWPVTVSLAAGKSHIVLANSVARFVAFPLALVFVKWLGGLAGVIVAFIVAEFFAFIVSLMQLHRHNLGDVRRDWVRLGQTVALFAGVALTAFGTTGSIFQVIFGSVLVVATIPAFLGSERETLLSFVNLLRRRGRGGAQGSVK